MASICISGHFQFWSKSHFSGLAGCISMASANNSNATHSQNVTIPCVRCGSLWLQFVEQQQHCSCKGNFL